MGEQLGVFLAHPAVQGLPAVLETPGTDGHGPEAEDVQLPARPARAREAEDEACHARAAPAARTTRRVGRSSGMLEELGVDAGAARRRFAS